MPKLMLLTVLRTPFFFPQPNTCCEGVFLATEQKHLKKKNHRLWFEFYLYGMNLKAQILQLLEQS